eukprot:699054-Prymnesium_polylepis.1
MCIRDRARACLDASLLEWEERRVARDSAVARRSDRYEDQQVVNCLAVERIRMEESTECLAATVARAAMDRYAARDGMEQIRTTEVHADLNDVYKALTPDDGDAVRRLCRVCFRVAFVARTQLTRKAYDFTPF